MNLRIGLQAHMIRNGEAHIENEIEPPNTLVQI
jgi:hypothetical protein